jgi:hypothetical protein
VSPLGYHEWHRNMERASRRGDCMDEYRDYQEKLNQEDLVLRQEELRSQQAQIDRADSEDYPDGYWIDDTFSPKPRKNWHNPKSRPRHE